MPDQIDHHFKSIYGRFPSGLERRQFKQNRPRGTYITQDDIEAI